MNKPTLTFPMLITTSLLFLAQPVFAKAQIDQALYTAKDSEPVFSSKQMLISQMCTQAQFETELYRQWCDEIKQTPSYHRKQWEFVYILQALKERDLIKKGMRGVGFGVGMEPLPAVFAKNEVTVLATDLDVKHANSKQWVSGKQHLSLLENLNVAGIATDAQIKDFVKLQFVDMRHIPEDISGYDFTWSSCALEHLGSIERGLKFIENSLNTLRPGGIAVHTTEYNLSSDEDTLDNTGTVLFRKKDIQELVSRLTAAGHEIYVNYNFGSGELDNYVDLPPYSGDKHLKLKIHKYVSTSIGLIIRKKS